jgi:hypothetical protein
MMDRAQNGTLAAQRNAILGLLLALAAAAWALLLAWPGSDPGMAMASPTMGLRAPLFLAIWVTMMVAMMFPSRPGCSWRATCWSGSWRAAPLT